MLSKNYQQKLKSEKIKLSNTVNTYESDLQALNKVKPTN